MWMSKIDGDSSTFYAKPSAKIPSDGLVDFLRAYRNVSKQSGYGFIQSLLHCLRRRLSKEALLFASRCGKAADLVLFASAEQIFGPENLSHERLWSDLCASSQQQGFLRFLSNHSEALCVRHRLLQRFDRDPLLQAIGEHSCIALPVFDEHHTLIAWLAMFGTEAIDGQEAVALLLENLCNRLGRELEQKQWQLLNAAPRHQAQEAAIDAANQAAAGMVHEIRNPLSFVLNSAQLARQRLEACLVDLQVDRSSENQRDDETSDIPSPCFRSLRAMTDDLAIVEAQAQRLNHILSVYTKQVCLLDRSPEFVCLSELLQGVATELQHWQNAEGAPSFQFTIQREPAGLMIYIFREALEKVLRQIFLTMLMPGRSHATKDRSAQVFVLSFGIDQQHLQICLSEDVPEAQAAGDIAQLGSLQHWRPLHQGIALSWSLQMISELYGGDILCNRPGSAPAIFVVRLPFQAISGCC